MILSTYKNFGPAATCLGSGAQPVASAEECDAAAVILGLDRRVGTIRLVQLLYIHLYYTEDR